MKCEIQFCNDKKIDCFLIKAGVGLGLLGNVAPPFPVRALVIQFLIPRAARSLSISLTHHVLERPFRLVPKFLREDIVR